MMDSTEVGEELLWALRMCQDLDLFPADARAGEFKLQGTPYFHLHPVHQSPGIRYHGSHRSNLKIMELAHLDSELRGPGISAPFQIVD